MTGFVPPAVATSVGDGRCCEETKYYVRGRVCASQRRSGTVDTASLSNSWSPCWRFSGPSQRRLGTVDTARMELESMYAARSQTTIGTCRNCGVTIYRLSERDLWKHGDAASGDVKCMVGYASPWPDDAERFCSIERESSHTVKVLADGICPVCRKPRRLLKSDGSDDFV